MQTVLAILVAFTLTLAANGQERPPNIVFILADDLGWADLSCYGQTHWETPELDRMAREGMRFTDAYAGSTVCAPSRAALLTGQHTGRTFMRGNGRITLRPDPLDITVASRLRDMGYATAMIGKSGVACLSDDPNLPNRKGFDHFYGLLDHVRAHRNYPGALIRNGERVPLPGNEGKTGVTYANELFIEDAIDWMGVRGDEPFFLHLALTTPHADLTVPERYAAPFRGRFEEVPHTTSGYYHQSEPRAVYAGMIAFLDESVGRVLESLRERGLDENTVVFFASDNGPHFEGGAHPDAFDSNGPFRGGKRDLYEGGIRTPQLVWWPGTIPAGTTTDHPTAFWDFPATAVELASANAVTPARITDDPLASGISIVPTLLGHHELQQTHGFLYWEFHEQGGKQAIRVGDWKAVRLNAKRQPRGPIELYDLATDPGENRNVAGDHPEIARRLTRLLNEAHTPSNRFFFGERPAPTDADPAGGDD